MHTRRWRWAAGLVMIAASMPACQAVLDLKSAVLDPEGAAGAGGEGGSGGSSMCETGEQESCYDGPAELKDVGECKSGKQTCGDDGAWGACVGSVAPEPETCASDKDENCDGFDCGLWSRIYGDSGYQLPVDVAVDYEGNVYVVGILNGTISFLGMPVIGSSDANAFLAKLSSSGDEVWIKKLIGPARIAVDSGGNVVVATHFPGTMNFGGRDLVSAGMSDIAIVMLASDGSHIWSQRVGGVQGETVSDVAIGPSGDVVIVGSFQGTADFGGQSLSSSNGSQDLFVAKLEGETGAVTWSKAFGDGEDQTAGLGPFVAIDPADNIILVGDYSGSITFGSQPLPAAGVTASSFLAKFDGTGTHYWSARLCQGECHPTGLAVDGTGSTVIVGTFPSQADFGPQTLSSVGETDIFLVKFSSGKDYQWGLQFGDEDSQAFASIAVEENGQITVAMPFAGTVSLGGASFTDKGHTDFAVGKISPTGNHLWSRQFGDDSHQISCLVAVASAGEVVLAGAMGGSVNFGTGALTAAGDEIAETDVAVVGLGR